MQELCKVTFEGAQSHGWLNMSEI